MLDVYFDGVGWDKSARVRITICTRNGDIAILEIKYKRLPSFCYICGGDWAYRT